VEVEIKIEQVSRREVVVPVVAGPGARVRPDSVRVTIEGPASVVSSLPVVSARIQADTLAPGKYDLAPVFKLPSDIRVVEVEPGTVEVHIR